MPNQRKQSKKLVGFYAEPDERAALAALAGSKGMSMAEYLRWLIAENKHAGAAIKPPAINPRKKR